MPTYPQRLLLSGLNAKARALEIAAELNRTDPVKITAGIATDALFLEDLGESFKIGDEEKPEKNSARGLIKWINQTPLAPHRIVILENFERASREAPQALLKVLEEPPSRAQFIFTTQNHHQLLATILSRMTVVLCPEVSADISTDEEARNFLNNSVLERFKQIEALDGKIKKEANKKLWGHFMKNVLLAARQDTRFNQSLEITFEAEQQLKRNVNPRLVFENLDLHLNA